MEFQEQNINNMIKHWRLKKNKADSGSNEELMARCYVDAFQTVRANHGLESLPKEEVDGSK